MAKALIQHLSTREFLSRSCEAWTSSRDLAAQFDTIQQAQAICRTRQLTDVQVVIHENGVLYPLTDARASHL